MLKPYIQRRDGSAKGDWDVGITLDAIEIAPDVDRVILVSVMATSVCWWNVFSSATTRRSPSMVYQG